MKTIAMTITAIAITANAAAAMNFGYFGPKNVIRHCIQSTENSVPLCFNFTVNEK